MSTQRNASNGSSFLTLNDAQKRLRDAYFDHDSGLFIMNAVPGAGKSVTVADLAAREILQRYAAGDPAPEQTVTVLSFNAEQADELGPKIAKRLEALVEQNATPAATAIEGDGLSSLTRRIRQSNAIGTVDSLLREIFSDFLGAVGFEEMPAVGDHLHLGQLHASIYANLAIDDAVTDELHLLMDAYPPDDYEDAPATLLKRGLNICRQQRLSTEEFRDHLLESVEAVYPDGPPDEPADLVSTLHRVLDRDAATDLEDSLSADETKAVIEADTGLYEDWQETIEAYTTVLDEYRARYREAIRQRSILSHTDVAYLVASFLDGSHAAADEYPKLRERVLGRYHHRLQSLVIDEAQDISTIQHDALAPLVEGDSRVFLAGDLRQSIYVWRDARPSLFAQAIEDGQYFGQSWTTHVTETTQTTYRARPDIAGAIDSICERTLTDDHRGNLADFDVEYPRLTPARDAVEGANIHVAGFKPNGPPGTPWYVEDGGRGEAPALAKYLAFGLSAGDFDIEGEEDPSVMVLFRWRTHMDTYREAFEAAGLTVANAASYLFDADSTKIVLDVLDWLTDPTKTKSLQSLVRESTLGIENLEPALSKANWTLGSLVESDSISADLDDGEIALIEQLYSLQCQAPRLRNQPVTDTIREIIDTLALRADTYDVTDTDPEQRVANCDAITAYVEEATSDVEIDLRELQHRLGRIREAPYTGPSQPLPDTNTDVIFQTIHQAKGDEADIVALADPAFPIHKHGPVGERLIAAPGVHALAPPANAAGKVMTEEGDTVALDPHYGGLYTPTADLDPNSQGVFPVEGGLRWASENWGENGFFGHDHLQQAVGGTRAESWRLLYVALTRSRDHLVLPLPWSIMGEFQPRDRWLDTLIEGLGFEGVESAGEYALDGRASESTSSTQPVPISVSDADSLPISRAETDLDESRPPAATVDAVDAETLPPHIPRFVRPSTLKPLADDYEGNVLAHLQNEPLHTDTGAIDPNLPLEIEAMGAEAIGSFAHKAITRALAADLDAQDLREESQLFETILTDALAVHGPPASKTEREGLWAFFTECVVPDLLDSQLWADFKRANKAFTEVPVRGEYAFDGGCIEVEGQADFVLQLPDGSWQVIDLKVTLTEPNDETRDRYRTQVSMYTDLFGSTVESEIESAVETVGATAERSTSPWNEINESIALESILGRQRQ